MVYALMTLLILLVACDSQPTPTATATPVRPTPAATPVKPTPAATTSPSSGLKQESGAGCAGRFGGPYEYKGGALKGAQFQAMQANGYSFSRGEKADKSLVENSVKQDKSRGPFLRYNYVIDAQDCEVYVAVWHDDSGTVPSTVPTSVICFSGNRSWSAKQGKMIDFYQESRKPAIVESSPCWLNLVSGMGGQDLGILDAVSKHFMLAQPKGKKRIDKMNLATADKVKVAYAGEIVVDTHECTYEVNANSGTYQPISPVPADVLEHFGKKLEELPSNLRNVLGYTAGKVC